MIRLFFELRETNEFVLFHKNDLICIIGTHFTPLNREPYFNNDYTLIIQQQAKQQRFDEMRMEKHFFLYNNNYKLHLKSDMICALHKFFREIICYK